MKNELLLLAGSDIPFPEAQVTIHQPTLKEIGYIGEKAFFIGCGLLDFSKNLLNESDKNRLANYDDFEILMTIMINKTDETREIVNSAFLVLSLIFPLYEVCVRKDEVAIILIKDNHEFKINKINFPIFKKNFIHMFNLKDIDKDFENYNPAGSMAEKIANKFKKRQEQLLKIKSKNNNTKENFSILNKYASILAVGLQKDLNSLMQYTIYQLYNEFQRFQMKMQWDAYIQAKMAGAQDLEEIDNWMSDLTQDKNKNKK